MSISIFSAYYQDVMRFNIIYNTIGIWTFTNQNYAEDDGGYECMPAGCFLMERIGLPPYYAVNHEIG